MGTKRRDRTGDEYGSFRVTGPDQISPHLWGGIWGCCDRYQAVTVERCGALAKNPPKRCIQCVRKEAPEKQVRDRDAEREKRAAKKALENHPEERGDQDATFVAGWGCAISGAFGRMGATGHETQGWRREYEWAADDA